MPAPVEHPASTAPAPARHPRRLHTLLPPMRGRPGGMGRALCLALLAGMALGAAPAPERVAGPTPESDDDEACFRLGVRFEMEGWVILGVCEQRLCFIEDEDGSPFMAGMFLGWYEEECGPLGSVSL
jgi:hypothetical protein